MMRYVRFILISINFLLVFVSAAFFLVKISNNSFLRGNLYGTSGRARRIESINAAE